MRENIRSVSTVLLKRQNLFTVIFILLFIIVIHSLLRLNNTHDAQYARDTNDWKPSHVYTQKALQKDYVFVKRPFRIDEYEDKLRNLPAEECKCFKKVKLANNSVDIRQINSQNMTSKNQPSEECTKRRFPRAMVVGMTKGGTTALMTFLNKHPGVAARTTYPLDTRYFNHYINTKDLEWYRHLLPCSYSNQITIEKSTEYFFTEECAKRIKQFDPSMKIIIAIKDPIVRSLSQYLMWKDQASFRVGEKTFEQMVTSEKNSEIDETSRLIIVSNYQKHMKVWLENFSLNQILFVDGHNFVSNPAEEINKVEDFLGIERYFTQESFVYNSTKGKYCLSLPGDQIDCLEAKKGMYHPTIDKNLREKLENYFNPLNELFFKMINRRFDWGY